MSRPKPCRFFRQGSPGSCTYGAKCRFSHALTETAPSSDVHQIAPVSADAPIYTLNPPQQAMNGVSDQSYYVQEQQQQYQQQQKPQYQQQQPQPQQPPQYQQHQQHVYQTYFPQPTHYQSPLQYHIYQQQQQQHQYSNYAQNSYQQPQQHTYLPQQPQVDHHEYYQSHPPPMQMTTYAPQTYEEQPPMMYDEPLMDDPDQQLDLEEMLWLEEQMEFQEREAEAKFFKKAEMAHNAELAQELEPDELEWLQQQLKELEIGGGEEEKSDDFHKVEQKENSQYPQTNEIHWLQYQIESLDEERNRTVFETLKKAQDEEMKEQTQLFALVDDTLVKELRHHIAGLPSALVDLIHDFVGFPSEKDDPEFDKACEEFMMPYEHMSCDLVIYAD